MTDPIADVNALANRIRQGYEPSAEEMRLVLERLRVGRATIIEKAESKQRVAKANSTPRKSVVLDLDSLFAQEDITPVAESSTPSAPPPKGEWDPLSAFNFGSKS